MVTPVTGQASNADYYIDDYTVVEVPLYRVPALDEVHFFYRQPNIAWPVVTYTRFEPGSTCAIVKSAIIDNLSPFGRYRTKIGLGVVTVNQNGDHVGAIGNVYGCAATGNYGGGGRYIDCYIWNAIRVPLSGEESHTGFLRSANKIAIPTSGRVHEGAHSVLDSTHRPWFSVNLNSFTNNPAQVLFSPVQQRGAQDRMVGLYGAQSASFTGGLIDGHITKAVWNTYNGAGENFCQVGYTVDKGARVRLAHVGFHIGATPDEQYSYFSRGRAVCWTMRSHDAKLDKLFVASTGGIEGHCYQQVTVYGMLLFSRGNDPVIPNQNLNAGLLTPDMKLYVFKFIPMDALAVEVLTQSSVKDPKLALDPQGYFILGKGSDLGLVSNFNNSIKIPKLVPPPISLPCIGACNSVPFSYEA